MLRMRAIRKFYEVFLVQRHLKFRKNGRGGPSFREIGQNFNRGRGRTNEHEIFQHGREKFSPHHFWGLYEIQQARGDP